MTTPAELTIEQAAARLVELILKAEPQHREAQMLKALRGAKLVAYRENEMAARFHAGPHGAGITGLIDGIGRAIDSMHAEIGT
jgi:hypothetical protein